MGERAADGKPCAIATTDPQAAGTCGHAGAAYARDAATAPFVDLVLLDAQAQAWQQRQSGSTGRGQAQEAEQRQCDRVISQRRRGTVEVSPFHDHPCRPALGSADARTAPDLFRSGSGSRVATAPTKAAVRRGRKLTQQMQLVSIVTNLAEDISRSMDEVAFPHHQMRSRCLRPRTLGPLP